METWKQLVFAYVPSTLGHRNKTIFCQQVTVESGFVTVLKRFSLRFEILYIRIDRLYGVPDRDRMRALHGDRTASRGPRNVCYPLKLFGEFLTTSRTRTCASP